jgi:outer membrane receptor protein involved in Fe transport
VGYNKNFRTAILLAGASIVSLVAGQAMAQGAPAAVEEVVVTGSRIVSSINATAPTPVTAVSTEQLLQTTPSNVPDALNKLPVFQGSSQPRRPGAGGTISAANVLSLRGFGAQRTLILVDGHRVAPSTERGTTNIDTIPQMLIQRVDITTGGASAVYGSDAVTGVVNFIIDKRFKGIKTDVNAGVSKYGDGEAGKLAIAGGAELFGGKGHILGSASYRKNGDVIAYDRKYGREVWTRTGTGGITNGVPNPFTETINARRADSTDGGLVLNCVAPCPAAGQNFYSNGVLSPFNNGAATGTGNIRSGGDGAQAPYSTAFVKGSNTELFSRFSYDFDNGINFFAQGSFAQADNTGHHFVAKMTPTAGFPTTFYKNNPFLPAATQVALGNNGLNNNTNTFQIGSYINSLGPDAYQGTRNLTLYQQFQTGINGDIGKYHWDAYYTYGHARTKVESLNNQDYQKQFAALDAVVGPNGTVACYAATQAATAAAYAGCVPLNAFGPTAITQATFDWFTETTQTTLSNSLSNVGGSFTGELFNIWAGPIDFAISGEARWNDYEVVSTASPTQLVNCTGLRICTATQPRWAQPVTANVKADSHVWEAAAELSIPLLKDLALVQSLNASLAGRYTDYSTSGSVETWKAGLDWTVNELLRFRGTVSRDIRAPTLDDLYRPQTGSSGQLSDVHTGVQTTLFTYAQGNPNLVPEVARTYTLGAVFTPSDLLPGFTASVDWYKIRLNNSIGTINANTSSVQTICENSGGTSQYCALYERPLPFSNRTAANFPTRVFNLSLNTALQEIEGYDAEANYRFSALGGAFTARVLGNYQPTNQSMAFPGAPLTYVAAAKKRVTSTLRFEKNGFGISLQDRWLSKFSQRTADGQLFAHPTVGSFNTVDVNIDWKTAIRGVDTTFYLTIENATDAVPPLYVTSTSVGLGLPIQDGYDLVGRYFTLGVRARF